MKTKRSSRYIGYVYLRESPTGSKASVNIYDDVAKWITYVSDFSFGNDMVWKKGLGWPAKNFQKKV